MIGRHVACLCVVIALSVHAQSNPPAPAPSEFGKGKGKTSTSNQDSKANKHQPEKQSVFVEIAPGQVTQVIAAIEARERNKKPPGEWVVLGIQAGAAIIVAIFTVLLWVSTKGLWRATRMSAEAAKQTAEAVSSAAAPFLVPRLSGFRLYPIDRDVGDDEVHRPSIMVRFENVGETPAIIRKVGAKLLLIGHGQMPPAPPEFDGIKSIDRSDTIANGKSGAAKRWTLNREILAGEIRQLRARPIRSQPFLRFHVIGYAVYDDVFGIRHKQGFCVKVRQEKELQRQRAGEAYNYHYREKAPKDEPPGATTEGE